MGLSAEFVPKNKFEIENKTQSHRYTNRQNVCCDRINL